MESFEKKFNGKLEEVFIYITSKCNLRCLHCYMGDAGNVNMDKNNFKKLLNKLIKLGASKITFLGGEPTLHPFLPEFIEIAKQMGVGYVRLDTNGEFDSKLLNDAAFKKLSDISFSLDGVDAKTHAKIRSVKNYNSIIKNIKKAVALKYKVRVTMTANSYNFRQIEKVAAKLDKMGVSSLNVHLISANGRAKDNGILLVREEDWMDYYNNVLPRLRKYKIKVKIPKRFIKKDESQDYGITCESAKASRLLMTADFKIFACPLLLDTGKNFAFFENGKFHYIKDYKKHSFEYSDMQGPACPILMKDNFIKFTNKDIIPLCVSCKQRNYQNNALIEN